MNDKPIAKTAIEELQEDYPEFWKYWLRSGPVRDSNIPAPLGNSDPEKSIRAAINRALMRHIDAPLIEPVKARARIWREMKRTVVEDHIGESFEREFEEEEEIDQFRTKLGEIR